LCNISSIIYIFFGKHFSFPLSEAKYMNMTENLKTNMLSALIAKP